MKTALFHYAVAFAAVALNAVWAAGVLPFGADEGIAQRRTEGKKGPKGKTKSSTKGGKKKCTKDYRFGCMSDGDCCTSTPTGVCTNIHQSGEGYCNCVPINSAPNTCKRSMDCCYCQLVAQAVSQGMIPNGDGTDFLEDFCADKPAVTPMCAAATKSCLDVNICFPGDAVVHEEEKGYISLDELEIGDKILTSTGYSQVFAFGHHADAAQGEFIQLKTGPEESLELSAFHQVFVGKDKTPNYAKDVTVGEFLVSPLNDLVKVISVDTVMKKGVYNPYTYDGTLFVNGVLASCHSHSPSVVLLGGIEVVSKHKFKYMTHAPARMLCSLGPGTLLCRHNKDGKVDVSTLIDYVLHKLVPGLRERETNFLAPNPTLPLNVALLLLWILPVYAMEQAGLLNVLLVIVAGWHLYSRRASSNKKDLKSQKRTQ